MKHLAVCALAAGLLLSACGTERHVADELTTFNEAQQQGTAQLVLLNILRARERQPLAYSHFDVLRGGISGSASTGLVVPFGPGAAANSLATGIGLTPGISQDVKPQDDQDFYRGILTPISAETWALYQDQNWSPDLLFHMFVEYIKLSRADFDTIFAKTAELCRQHAEISDVAEGCSGLARTQAEIDGMAGCEPDTVLFNGKPILKLLNDPGDRCRQLQYDALTAAMAIMGFHIAQQTTRSDIGPPMPPATLHDPQWPFSLKGSNVEIAGTSGGYQFKTVSKDYVVSLSNMPCLGDANIAVAATSEIGAQIQSAKADARAVPRDCQAAQPLVIGITTRSPDGILYYLGEVARAALPVEPGTAPKSVFLRGDNGGTVALLSLVAGDLPDAAVRVDYRGNTYSVPRGGAHITMQAFELLEQVFALYNRASVTPSTTAVTVVP
jgi:hypothetical protein